MVTRTIAFEFDMDGKVTTPFGDPGIISMLGYDDGGICYYVRTQTGGNWFKEKDLQGRS